MPDPVPRYYWDANVFLHYINGSPDKMPTIEQLLLHARKHEIEIVTSVLSVAEVAFAATEKMQSVVDSAIEEKIDSLWLPDAPVTLIEFHRLIAQDARSLMRDALRRQWQLKPSDAVHLASAQRMGVTEVHTYESKWVRYGVPLGVAIKEPWAAQVGMLPPT